MTKYGEEMTNALFPFIKPGPAAVFPALGPHAPQKAHFNHVTHLFRVPLLILLW